MLGVETASSCRYTPAQFSARARQAGLTSPLHRHEFRLDLSRHRALTRRQIRKTTTSAFTSLHVALSRNVASAKTGPQKNEAPVAACQPGPRREVRRRAARISPPTRAGKLTRRIILIQTMKARSASQGRVEFMSEIGVGIHRAAQYTPSVCVVKLHLQINLGPSIVSFATVSDFHPSAAPCGATSHP